MKREKTQFRRVAALAKSRLTTGFWEQKHERAALEYINEPNGEEEQFYNRINSAIQGGSTNLLEVMLDKAHMEQLSESERQRYVLNMSFRVNKVINKLTCVS